MNIYDVLRQISDYCESHLSFRVGIYMLDHSRCSTIERLLRNVIGSNDLEGKNRIFKSNGVFEVRYVESGSTIQIVTASESTRGRKYNLILAENQIDQYLKQAVIYPSLFPEMQEAPDDISSTLLHHSIEYLEFELL